MTDKEIKFVATIYLNNGICDPSILRGLLPDNTPYRNNFEPWGSEFCKEYCPIHTRGCSPNIAVEKAFDVMNNNKKDFIDYLI